MSTTTLQFEPSELQFWRGRYARIPSETSVFHLRYHNGRRRAAIYWETDEGRATCYALDCDAANELADAVERAKLKAGGTGGGSFVINEFGQVLVPSSIVTGVRVFAGQLHGNLLFDNPFYPDSPIDLSDASGLIFGDPWKLPYVGMPFILSSNREIQFKQLIEDGTETMYPKKQDASLAMDIYSVRGSSCRFIVNPAGIVLTKRQCKGGWWYPHYVGEITKSKWFAKEEF